MRDRHLEASQAIDARRQALAEAIVARQYELQPARWQPYGSTGRATSVRDAGYHLSYLSAAVAAKKSALFTDYVGWVKVLFAGLEFSDSVLTTTLDCIRQVLLEELAPRTGAVVAEYIALGLDRVRQSPTTLATYLEPDAELGELARRYLDALLGGERRRASELILNAVQQGTGVKDLYLHVFQPTQHEIGRLWQMNRITVAQEHYCTAATQLIMAQLYPYLFRTERTGRRLVAACVGDELHELGVRMVADFFELEGWDTYYLGANTPADAVLEALARQEADALAISATMTFHVKHVAALIECVRSENAGRAAAILVGGYPFNVAPGLWQDVGADGFARNAEEAVHLANRLVGGSP